MSRRSSSSPAFNAGLLLRRRRPTALSRTPAGEPPVCLYCRLSAACLSLLPPVCRLSVSTAACLPPVCWGGPSSRPSRPSSGGSLPPSLPPSVRPSIHPSLPQISQARLLSRPPLRRTPLSPRRSRLVSSRGSSSSTAGHAGHGTLVPRCLARQQRPTPHYSSAPPARAPDWCRAAALHQIAALRPQDCRL
jgi:hypothetical protein